MNRPCQNCGQLGGDPRWCRHCDTVAPHELPTLERHRRMDLPLIVGFLATVVVGAAFFAGLVLLCLAVLGGWMPGW